MEYKNQKIYQGNQSCRQKTQEKKKQKKPQKKQKPELDFSHLSARSRTFLVLFSLFLVFKHPAQNTTES